jgi:hypothetical protein
LEFPKEAGHVTMGKNILDNKNSPETESKKGNFQKKKSLKREMSKKGNF